MLFIILGKLQSVQGCSLYGGFSFLAWKCWTSLDLVLRLVSWCVHSGSCHFGQCPLKQVQRTKGPKAVVPCHR